MKDPMNMNEQQIVDWLEEKIPDIFLHAGEHPLCKYAAAFAARDYCVNKDLAMTWHEKLMEVPEFPWHYTPEHWLRAAMKVIQETKP